MAAGEGAVNKYDLRSFVILGYSRDWIVRIVEVVPVAFGPDGKAYSYRICSEWTDDGCWWVR